MPPDDENDQKEKNLRVEPLSFGSTASQDRALSAVRESTATLGGAMLLGATGPLAELKSAERSHILDEVRRTLIAKKGRGVVFEAHAVAQFQEAGERYDLRLTARLAATSNAPRADLVLLFQEQEIEVQLKAGSDNYIKAAIRAHEKDVLLLVPKDAAEQQWAVGATGSLSFEDVTIETPTRDDLLRRTEHSLDRLASGEPIQSSADMARRAFCDGLTDGIVAVALDLCAQKLTHPELPIDWKRSTKCLVKVGATSAISSFLASANTQSSLALTTHTIDAGASFRVGRVAACLVPHALDVGFDFLDHAHGKLSTEELLRNISGHTGAATAEYFMFPYLARLAARLGPLGILVFLVGGAIISKVGDVAGRFLFDLFSLLPYVPVGGSGVPAVSAPSFFDSLLTAAAALQPKALAEAKRRADLAEKRICEELRCGRPHHARGWCARHYQRWWRRQRRTDWRLYTLAQPAKSRRHPGPIARR